MAEPTLTPQIVIDAFESDGEFFASGSKAYWQEDFAAQDPHDIDSWSPPVDLTSGDFRRMLGKRFNKLQGGSAKKTKDIVAALTDYAYGLKHKPAVVWSRWTGAALQIAISNRHAVEIDAQGIRVLRNGDTAVFTPPQDFEPIRWTDILKAWRSDGPAMPRMRAALTDEMPPPVATDITKYGPIAQHDHAALMTAFWLGTVAEPMMKGRPVLAILGGYGSGKTVTARILGTLYYGADFDVEGGTGGSRAVKDLIASVNASPLAVRDDMNREPIEIVDTICRLATGSKVSLSTLHETLEVSKFTARGAIVVTAHTPTWALRPDLLSRMLIVRIDKPVVTDSTVAGLTGEERCARAAELRVGVWADTFASLQGMMQQHGRWLNVSRFEGWESITRRCALAGGWFDALHSALHKMAWQRVNVAQYTDPWLATVLVVAQEMVQESNFAKWYTAAEMYDLIAMRMGGQISADAEHRPSASAFRSQRTLGQWLGQIERDGAAVCDVERGPLRNGIATWRLRPKAG